MRVKVRRRKCGISRWLALFLVILFISTATGGSMSWRENWSALTHWQPADGHDCRDHSTNVVSTIDRSNLQPGLLAEIPGKQNKGITFRGTNATLQSNRKNPGDPIKSIEIQESFSAGYLDPERWKIIEEGDVQQKKIDVIAVDPLKPEVYRLRLGMNTIGTDDDTVKYIGVRTIDKLSLRVPREISFDLDWNNQSNGCYLSAAVFLCPTVTNTNPEREKNWLRLEYIGVPPGKNARAVIVINENGNIRHLYTEGWPENRSGRHIGFQRIKMIFDVNGFTVLENGGVLYQDKSINLKYESTYLYFMMSSHSNYPFREVYFGNISVQEK